MNYILLIICNHVINKKKTTVVRLYLFLECDYVFQPERFEK